MGKERGRERDEDENLIQLTIKVYLLSALQFILVVLTPTRILTIIGDKTTRNVQNLWRAPISNMFFNPRPSRRSLLFSDRDLDPLGRKALGQIGRFYEKLLSAINPRLSTKNEIYLPYLSCLETSWLNMIRMVLRKQWPEHRTLGSFDLQYKSKKVLGEKTNTYSFQPSLIHTRGAE